MRVYLILSMMAMCLVTSCSDSDINEVPHTSANDSYPSVELLSNGAQRNFIKEICNINKEYQNSKTRIDQGDIANGTKWLLTAGVDGIGGAVGGVALGWLTGAAASSLYSTYLDGIVAQGTRSSSSFNEYVDVTKNKKYNDLYRAVAFRFCDNKPRNAQDSIGYVHNELLNEFMTKNKRKYRSDNAKIDFKSFYADYKKTVASLGYSSEYVDEVFNQNMSNCLGNIIKPFANLQTNTQTVDNVFDMIELSLCNDAGFKEEDAKFMSLLVKNLILSLSEGISVEEIPSYSEKLNDALKQSKLSEDNVSMCKRFFQTMVCSYIYWKHSKL